MSEHKIYHVAIFILCIFYTNIIYGGYQVTEIGDSHVYGTALNNSNTVVGYIQPTTSVQNRYGFIWSKNTGVQSIGGYEAYSINDNGVIAGQDKINGYVYGAVWENGIMITLTDRQEIDSINNKGQCTGLISAQPYIPGPYSPFRDDDIHTPGFIELVNPFLPDYAGQGFDINNKGQVIAGCKNSFVFYDSDGSYTILNDGSYSYHWEPLSINDLGQIVGGARTISDLSTLRAVYWNSPLSNMILMGRLGSGYGYANAINNQGVAVGEDSDKAFIWSLKMGMTDLNTLIDPALGITLTNAVGINDYGNILAMGVNSFNEHHTYLAVTPEPSTLLLLGLGAALLRKRR